LIFRVAALFSSGGGGGASVAGGGALGEGASCAKTGARRVVESRTRESRAAARKEERIAY
jgi:hypothetical protein